MLYVESDSLVAQLIHEVRLPVPLQTRRIKPVEHALQNGKRHGLEKLKGRRAETPQRIKKLICLVQRSSVAPYNAAHFLEVQSFRERRPGRDGEKCKETANLFRRLNNELAIPFHDIGGLVQIPQHRAGTYHLNRMCLEQERRHHTEVSSASTDSPEQIFSSALATANLPSARTTSAANRLSMVNPYFRVKCPMPPPRVKPPTPVVEMIPDGTASPNACVT